MSTWPIVIRSYKCRIVAAAVAAVLCIVLTQSGVAVARAVQDEAKKGDAAKGDTSSELLVPPPIKPDDDEWLSIEFDRLRLAVENANFPDRVNFISKNDKNADGKLSPAEWPATIPYKFESFDWNEDGFVDSKELAGVIVDVEILSERPLPKIEPGAPQDAKLKITLATGAHEEKEVLRSKVTDVKYFEDLLIEQARRAMTKGNMDQAFELLNTAAERQPEWRGLHAAVAEFWYKEAEARMGQLQYERAIDLLHEMKDYCAQHNAPEHDRTSILMGFAIKGVVDTAILNRQFMLARPRLFRMEKDYPDHPMVKVLYDRLIQGSEAQPGAERLRAQAKEREAAGQARDASFLILQAADMWPRLPGLDADFNRIYGKYPIVHVAVRELPTHFSPWAPPGTADARVAQLLHMPLMEVSGVGENTKYTSRILEEPELRELGRQIRLRVKPGLLWSDGEKAITAHDVARSITTRADRQIPNFDASLASVLKEIRVPAVNEVVVDLNRHSLRPQSSFLFNLAPGHRLQGDRFEQTTAVGAGPFRVLGRRTENEVYMLANRYFYSGPPKVAEIVERRYTSGKDAVKALLAGDVALVEHVPAKELKRIESRSNEFTVVRSAVPALHSIAFDFRTRFELGNWTLRRAMVYAIDRLSVLEGSILEGPSSDGNELINGAFPKGSFAFEPDLEPWPYDPVLAKGLVDAAKKELRVQSLSFRLNYPDVEEAREACRFIKQYWSVIGIEVELRPMAPQLLEEEIAHGQRFELVYRTHYVRDPVLDASRVLCLGPPIAPDGAVLPNAASTWLRQNLRDLAFATDWPVARNKLKLIQNQARDDVALIPLWQLTDHYAYQKRLEGVVDQSIGMYQDAEKWQISPWYRKDEQP
jgi:peptide/nickel transport system substrate-binding protein